MKTNNPLITKDMINAGFTAPVINYLNGTNTKLSIKILSWEEFLAIWSAQKGDFEKTEFFKQWMQPVVNLPKKLDAAGKNLLEKIDSLVEQFPQYSDFFYQHLPTTHAIKFTNNYSQIRKLWDRTTPKEKNALLELIKTDPKYTPQKYVHLLDYWNITENYPADRIIAVVFINAMIHANPEEAFKLWESDITFSSSQIESLAKKIIDEKSGFNFRSLVSFFIKTNNKLVLDELLRRIESESDLQNDFDKLRSDTTNELRLQLLPLLYKFTTKLEIENWWIDDYFISKHLPPYKKIKDPLLVGEIISKIANYYHKSPNGLHGPHFIELYAYCEEEFLVNFYIKSIPLYPHRVFHWAAKAYDLSQRFKIIETVIEHIIPKYDTYELEELVIFLDWLEINFPGTPYVDAIRKIKACNILQKLWEEKDGLTHGIAIARLLKHLHN